MTSPQTSRPGRAFLVYSALRLVLLVVSYSVLLAIGIDGLLAVGGAVLLSALLSLVLLRRQRDAFTEASMARAEQRRADKERRRVGLELGPADGLQRRRDAALHVRQGEADRLRAEIHPEEAGVAGQAQNRRKVGVGRDHAPS